MTPDERQLISDLFDRMRQQGRVEKDREADSLINQSVRQTPDSIYLLVQSVLAQEHYLQQAGSRIEELEGRIRDLEDEMARTQPQPQKSSGSFLGGLFGGGRQEQPAPRQASPSFGGGRAAPQPGEQGSPWGAPPPNRGGFAQQGSSWGQPPQMQQPTAPAGGGFMRSALTTAAGVAGGMMAANAISGMLGGSHGAQAAGHSTSSPASTESSPYEVVPSDRQREIDYQQDAADDAQMENEQVASLDDNADWGGADDSDF